MPRRFRSERIDPSELVSMIAKGLNQKGRARDLREEGVIPGGGGVGTWSLSRSTAVAWSGIGREEPLRE
jgi:hypothetical protein